MPFIPHTPSDVEAMLATIGAPDINALFDEIPAALRTGTLSAVPDALSEMEIAQLAQARAAQDRPLTNFIGAGAYEHHIPAAVWDITTRGEFYSAYTPYQAEASQGTLQLLYEYQSMMTALTGMDVSNASLYDGASALAEAVLMAERATRSPQRRVLVPTSVHPLYRKVLGALVSAQGIVIDELPLRDGRVDADAARAAMATPFTSLVLPQPNFFGLYEDADGLSVLARQHRGLVIGLVNPLSLALLKPPGEWGGEGADIVVGDGQPFGCPLSSGGPYFGFMTARQAHVRQMPGRIVGRTVDLEGKRGYTLTLQAREQHIRRAKATSNICTNQGLLVTAATIHLSLLGPQGLARVASQSVQRTAELVNALCSIDGVHKLFDAPQFHECALRLPVPAGPLLEKLAQAGIAGGFDLSRDYPGLGHGLLVCATEMRTSEQVLRYRDVLKSLLAA